MGFDKAKAIRAAEKHLAQGKIQAAIQEYRRIVDADASDYNALNTLGDLYTRVNGKREALACFKRVADHYRDQGFTLKAIAVYKKITRLDPADMETALDLGKLYEQQGHVVEARAQYLAIADACAREGRAADALDVLRRIADLDPQNTLIRLRLADGYAREGREELAADAYTDAGERLAARGEYEQALDAYTKALALRPAAHATLMGLVTVHSALGSADEAAEVLEEAVRNSPEDLELYAMLARAYIEAENATQAERATEQLVRLEPASFPVYFDVARLHLQQGNAEQASHLLGRVAEQPLKPDDEQQLQELLQETLARDPEQIEALHLLARVFVRQRDDERLRTVLERLADAAETAGDTDEERMALAKLVRLDPDEPRFAARLKALGGSRPGDESWGAGGDEAGAFDAASFENFAIWNDPAGRDAQAAAPAGNDFPLGGDAQGPASTSAPGDNSGGVGHNEFNFFESQQQPPPATAATPSAEGFQEVDFGAAQAAASATPGESEGRRVAELLKQELESVDFYIAQGYLDIALDTLDMLERQFGAHPEIKARRSALPADLAAAQPQTPATPSEVPPPAAAEAVEADAFERAEADAAASGGGMDAAADTEATVVEGGAPTPPAPVRATADAGIDPGLAAIFDEFREAVEDSRETPEHDFETHYNMGVAYSEMALLDQAVEELQKAVELVAPGDGTPRYLRACNLLGHCFMQKGLPRAAAIWFRKGLDAPGHDEDAYQALRYDLGTAYEQMGDLRRAVETFTEVYSIDVSYRGVSGKLRELQKRVTSDNMK